ncbi:hypothetical protein GGG16DRAFT_88138 [Schizophyllum commune]
MGTCNGCLMWGSVWGASVCARGTRGKLVVTQGGGGVANGRERQLWSGGEKAGRRRRGRWLSRTHSRQTANVDGGMPVGSPLKGEEGRRRKIGVVCLRLREPRSLCSLSEKKVNA